MAGQLIASPVEPSEAGKPGDRAEAPIILEPNPRVQAMAKLVGPYSPIWQQHASQADVPLKLGGVALLVGAVWAAAIRDVRPALILPVIALVIAWQLRPGLRMKCPRCDKKFFYWTPGWSLFARYEARETCAACGLPRWAPDRNASGTDFVALPPGEPAQQPEGWVVVSAEASLYLRVPGRDGVHIRATDDEVVVSGPLLQTRRHASDDLETVGVGASVPHGTPLSFAVFAATRSGQKLIVVDGFRKEGDAQFIAHELRRLWRMQEPLIANSSPPG